MRLLFAVLAVLVFVSGCREVEVKTGSVTVCEKCGKEIANNVETKLVASTDAEKYMVEKIKSVCDNCLKPVEWRLDQFDFGSDKVQPHCPECGTVVGMGKTVCIANHKFRWVKGTCPRCKGSGSLRCFWCGGTGKIITPCGYCYPKAKKDCQVCHGTKISKVDPCRNCNATGKDPCSACNGTGSVG